MHKLDLPVVAAESEELQVGTVGMGAAFSALRRRPVTASAVGFATVVLLARLLSGGKALEARHLKVLLEDLQAGRVAHLEFGEAAILVFLKVGSFYCACVRLCERAPSAVQLFGDSCSSCALPAGRRVERRRAQRACVRRAAAPVHV